MSAKTQVRAAVLVAVTVAAALALGACAAGQGTNAANDAASVAVHGDTASTAPQEAGTTEGSAPRPGAGVTARQLASVARTKVFFGHQSVGANVIGALPSVYAEHGEPAPRVVDLGTTSPPTDGTGYFGQAFIGVNGDPVGKLAAFDSMLRNGLGNQVDVAFMKFCYLDVNASTDVDGLFSAYRDTMTRLQEDFPSVTLLFVTTPLTTGDPTPVDNVAREQLNELIRKEYGDRVFDLAAIESTAPDGSRVGGEYQGHGYFSLYPGYAADNGHPNAEGSARAASALVELIDRARAS